MHEKSVERVSELEGDKTELHKTESVESLNT